MQLKFKMGKIQFTISLVAAAVVVLLLALMLSAGFWQLDRAQEKIDIMSAYAQASKAPVIDLNSQIAMPVEQLRFKRVQLTGRYLSEQQFLLDNQVYNKRVGYSVISPFLLADGSLLLVNRGWVLATGDRAILPDITVSESIQTMTGIVHVPSKSFRMGEMDADLKWPRVIQFLDFDILSSRLERVVYPATIMLDPEASNGFIREWQPVLEGPGKHYSYAVQWFAMSLTLLVLFVIISMKRTD